MAGGELFSLMNSKMDSFTKAEKRIAEYVITTPQKVLYMSITDLADACGVGETSVFRFCRSLSLKGYQEFKLVLAQSISGDDSSDAEDFKIEDTDTVSDISGKVLNSAVSVLNSTMKSIKPDDVLKAVEMMEKAEKIAFFGVGASLITAFDAYVKFMRITNKAVCTMDSHLQVMMAALLQPQDVAFIISYSGSTRDTMEIAQLCKKNGTKVIALTRYQKSPLSGCSDITLITAADEGPLQSGSISAKISQMYMLDILYAEYFMRNRKIAQISKKLTSESVLTKCY